MESESDGGGFPEGASMSECRNLEPMFAPYVDGEAEPPARAAVERHLALCPPCRDRIEAERSAREVLAARREGLRGQASDALRRRCEAQWAQTRPATVPAGPASSRPPQPGLLRRTVVPLALAASLLLVLATASFFGLNRGVELLAAQLAVDHVKCHRLASDDPQPDPVLLSTEWKRERGWPLKIPAGTPEHDLQLIGIRQCGSTEGPNAHIMYKWHGSPLSLYIMNEEARHTGPDAQFVSKLGQDAIIWTDGGRTYVVVADAPRRDLEPVVKYVKVNAKTW